jgi:hypothetical protein
MLHLYAALAEKERRLIADRTRQALAARKSHGAKAGESTQCTTGSRTRSRGSTCGSYAFAARVLPIIDALRRTGICGMVSLAAALNSRGVRTMRGGRWHPSTVQNLLRRSHRLL